MSLLEKRASDMEFPLATLYVHVQSVGIYQPANITAHKLYTMSCIHKLLHVHVQRVENMRSHLRKPTTDWWITIFEVYTEDSVQ